MVQTPARGNPPNQSDITGTNVTNSTGMNVEAPPGLDQETFNTARELSRQLQEAEAKCQASLSDVEDEPRRFALGKADEDETCTTAACHSLDRLLERAEQFLSSLDPEEVEKLQSLTDLRTW
jgi:hypothetical protein